jgi:hypothetical protein
VHQKSIEAKYLTNFRLASSFIFFSMAKHKEIKEELAKEDSNRKIPNITKLVSNAWRNITDEDRAKYDALAKEDKERYEREKATYVAPPGTSKKKLRDPTAPRRPMSAFLAFANSRRAQVKSEKPDCSNGEISKVLSRMWKEAEVEMKQKYRDEEAAHWVKYKAKMAEYRKKIDGMQKQAKAMQAAMEGMQSSMNDLKSNNEELLLNASDKVAKMSMSGLQEANSNLSGMLINANNLSTAPNREELIAASALYGVGGGANLLLGSGLQQAPVGNLGGYGALLGLNPNAGLAPFAGGLGGGVLGNATLMQDMSNPTNRALLELGLPLQQFAGYPLGNQQQALLAALGGAAAGYQMPLLGAGGVSGKSH